MVKEKDNRRPTAGLSAVVSAEIDGVVERAGGHLSPAGVRRIAEAVSQTHQFIPIIDEFDRLIDAQAVTLFTDTIESVLDHTRGTTVVLVAVGDTVDDLIAEHESVERSLIQVPMSRMSPLESAQILVNRKDVTGVGFEEPARDLIVALAQGLPHFTHLLGLQAVRTAADDLSGVVTASHVDQALARAIGASRQSLQRAYHNETTSPRKDNLFAQVLLACALAETDALG